jgi:hypothetical protein
MFVELWHFIRHYFIPLVQLVVDFFRGFVVNLLYLLGEFAVAAVYFGTKRGQFIIQAHGKLSGCCPRPFFCLIQYLFNFFLPSKMGLAIPVTNET